MVLQSKRTRLLLLLSAVFISSAITAELISSKLFQVHLNFGFIDLGSYITIIGIIPWPIVFLTTDIVNEFFGKRVVRWLSILTCFMIAYAFLIVFVAMQPPAYTGTPDHPIPNTPTDAVFNLVFGQSLFIIIGSIVAFLVSQLIDSFLFWFIRERTGGKLIWFRSTGSTLISQLFDSFIVLYIGFVLTNKLNYEDWVKVGLTNYVLKLVIAVALTPLIYLFHSIVEHYLGKEAHEQMRHSAEESLEHTVAD